MIEIYTDGASRGNPGESASSFVFVKERIAFKFSSFYLGKATNNIAEYKAIIFALKDALSSGFKEVLLTSDSELVISQINGKYKVKAEHLKLLAKEVSELSERFSEIEFRHRKRENKFVRIADKLCNLMLDSVCLR